MTLNFLIMETWKWAVEKSSTNTLEKSITLFIFYTCSFDERKSA